jgi:hypothetical protein
MKRMSEYLTIWHQVLVASDDEWLAEKVRLLCLLEKARTSGGAKLESKIVQIQDFIVKLDEEDEGLNVNGFMKKMMFCYPQLRTNNMSKDFVAANGKADLHIHPEWILDLDRLICPYDKAPLTKLCVSSEFDIWVPGCPICQYKFTPDEIVEIRQLMKIHRLQSSIISGPIELSNLLLN